MNSKHETCPKCGSSNVAGLVLAFWVTMDAGKQDEVRWQSETEIGPERMCPECEHEWESE